MFFLYNFFIVLNYYNTHSYTEGLSYFEGNILILCLLGIPALFVYCIFIIKNFKQIKHLCTLIYPLIIINICFSILCMLPNVIFFLMLPAIFLIPLMFIIGLIKDIKYLHKRNNYINYEE